MKKEENKSRKEKKRRRRQAGEEIRETPLVSISPLLDLTQVSLSLGWEEKR